MGIGAWGLLQKKFELRLGNASLQEGDVLLQHWKMPLYEVGDAYYKMGSTKFQFMLLNYSVEETRCQMVKIQSVYRY